MWAGFSGFSGSLIRYNLLSCLPPLADLTGYLESGALRRPSLHQAT